MPDPTIPAPPKWSDIESSPKFAPLPPEERAKVFDRWREDAAADFLLNADPGEADAANFAARAVSTRAGLLKPDATPDELRGEALKDLWESDPSESYWKLRDNPGTASLWDGKELVVTPALYDKPDDYAGAVKASDAPAYAKVRALARRQRLAEARNDTWVGELGTVLKDIPKDAADKYRDIRLHRRDGFVTGIDNADKSGVVYDPALNTWAERVKAEGGDPDTVLESWKARHLWGRPQDEGNMVRKDPLSGEVVFNAERLARSEGGGTNDLDNLWRDDLIERDARRAGVTDKERPVLDFMVNQARDRMASAMIRQLSATNADDWGILTRPKTAVESGAMEMTGFKADFRGWVAAHPDLSDRETVEGYLTHLQERGEVLKFTDQLARDYLSMFPKAESSLAKAAGAVADIALSPATSAINKVTGRGWMPSAEISRAVSDLYKDSDERVQVGQGFGGAGVGHQALSDIGSEAAVMLATWGAGSLATQATKGVGRGIAANVLRATETAATTGKAIKPGFGLRLLEMSSREVADKAPKWFSEGYFRGIFEKVRKEFPDALVEEITKKTEQRIVEQVSSTVDNLTRKGVTYGLASARSAGGTYSSAYQGLRASLVDAGMSEDEAGETAAREAVLPALFSGAWTPAIMRMIPGGAESVLFKDAAGKGVGSVTLRQLAKEVGTHGILRSFKDAGFRKALRSFLGHTALEGFREGAEEFTDEIGQSVVAMASYAPDMTIGQAFTQSLYAGGIGLGMGAAAQPFSGLAQPVDKSIIPAATAAPAPAATEAAAVAAAPGATAPAATPEATPAETPLGMTDQDVEEEVADANEEAGAEPAAPVSPPPLPGVPPNVQQNAPQAAAAVASVTPAPKGKPKAKTKEVQPATTPAKDQSGLVGKVVRLNRNSGWADGTKATVASYDPESGIFWVNVEGEGDTEDDQKQMVAKNINELDLVTETTPAPAATPSQPVTPSSPATPTTPTDEKGKRKGQGKRQVLTPAAGAGGAKPPATPAQPVTPTPAKPSKTPKPAGPTVSERVLAFTLATGVVPTEDQVRGELGAGGRGSDIAAAREAAKKAAEEKWPVNRPEPRADDPLVPTYRNPQKVPLPREVGPDGTLRWVFTNDPEVTALQLDQGGDVTVPEGFAGPVNPAIKVKEGKVESAEHPRYGTVAAGEAGVLEQRAAKDPKRAERSLRQTKGKSAEDTMSEGTANVYQKVALLPAHPKEKSLLGRWINPKGKDKQTPVESKVRERLGKDASDNVVRLVADAVAARMAELVRKVSLGAKLQALLGKRGKNGYAAGKLEQAKELVRSLFGDEARFRLAYKSVMPAAADISSFDDLVEAAARLFGDYRSIKEGPGGEPVLDESTVNRMVTFEVSHWLSLAKKRRMAGANPEVNPVPLNTEETDDSLSPSETTADETAAEPGVEPEPETPGKKAKRVVTRAEAWRVVHIFSGLKRALFPSDRDFAVAFLSRCYDGYPNTGKENVSREWRKWEAAARAEGEGALNALLRARAHAFNAAGRLSDEALDQALRGPLKTQTPSNNAPSNPARVTEGSRQIDELGLKDGDPDSALAALEKIAANPGRHGFLSTVAKFLVGEWKAGRMAGLKLRVFGAGDTKTTTDWGADGTVRISPHGYNHNGMANSLMEELLHHWDGTNPMSSETRKALREAMAAANEKLDKAEAWLLRTAADLGLKAEVMEFLADYRYTLGYLYDNGLWVPRPRKARAVEGGSGDDDDWADLMEFKARVLTDPFTRAMLAADPVSALASRKFLGMRFFDKRVIDKSSPLGRALDGVFTFRKDGTALTPRSGSSVIPEAALGTRVPEQVSMRLELDRARGFKLFGERMYNSSLPSIINKEVLQNSFDAIKEAEEKGIIGKGDGRIFVTSGNDGPETVAVRFDDNGVGMTPDIVREAFFTVGGTNKGAAKKSGGFGVAKVGIFMNASRVRLDTTRDGRRVVADVTNEQLTGDDPWPVSVENAEGRPNGTSVTLWFPKKWVKSDGSEATFAPSTPDTSLIYHDVVVSHRVPASYRGQDFDPSGVEAWQADRSQTPPTGYTTSARRNLSDYEAAGMTRVDVRAGKVSASVYYKRLGYKNADGSQKYSERLDLDGETSDELRNSRMLFLSNGLYQFSESGLRLKQLDWSSDLLPYSIIVDIDTGDIDPASDGYPFANNRESFIKGAAIKDKISQVVDGLRSEELENTFKQEFSALRGLDGGDPDPSKPVLYNNTTAEPDDAEQNFLRDLSGALFEGAELVLDSLQAASRDGALPYGNRWTRLQLPLAAHAVDIEALRKTWGDATREKDEAYRAWMENDDYADNRDERLKADYEAKKDKAYALERELDAAGGDSKRYHFGAALSRNWGGVHSGKKEPFVVLVNPVYADTGMVAKSPELTAALWYHLLVHEINHIDQRNEGAGFTYSLALVDSVLHSGGVRSKLTKRFNELAARHWDAIKTLKQKFDTSETKNNDNEITGDSVAELDQPGRERTGGGGDGTGADVQTNAGRLEPEGVDQTGAGAGGGAGTETGSAGGPEVTFGDAVDRALGTRTLGTRSPVPFDDIPNADVNVTRRASGEYDVWITDTRTGTRDHRTADDIPELREIRDALMEERREATDDELAEFFNSRRSGRVSLGTRAMSRVISVPHKDLPDLVAPKEYHRLHYTEDDDGILSLDTSALMASVRKRAAGVKDKVYGKKFAVFADGEKTELATPAALDKFIGVGFSDGATARVFKNGNNQIIVDFDFDLNDTNLKWEVDRLFREQDGVSLGTRVPVTPQLDADYLSAVERGDMETAQGMVDEAAKAAGYVVKAWHGTPGFRGNVFKPGRFGPLFFFAKAKKYADHYRDRFGVSPAAQTLEVWLKLDNPKFLEEVVQEGVMLARDTRREGFDGIETANAYVVFEPSQIKSADPVTYDAEGKVIPLSKRFNPQSGSILHTRAPEGFRFRSQDMLEQSLAQAGTNAAWTALPAAGDGTVPWQALRAKLSKAFRNEEADMVTAALEPLVEDDRIKVAQALEAMEALAKSSARVVRLEAVDTSDENVRRRNEIEHELDTYWPEWHENAYDGGGLMPESRFFNTNETFRQLPEQARELYREYHKLSSISELRGWYPVKNESATGKFTIVNPKPLGRMPDARDITVEEPYTPEAAAVAQAAGWIDMDGAPELDRIPDDSKKIAAQKPVKFSEGTHFPTRKNVIGFGRMYDEKWNGKPGTFVFEVQSDWAKSNTKTLEQAREQRDRNRQNNYAGMDPEARANDDADIAKLEQSTPLLSVHETLVLKAAIADAKAKGQDWVAVTDAETAMMTERHDRRTTDWRFSINRDKWNAWVSAPDLRARMDSLGLDSLPETVIDSDGNAYLRTSSPEAAAFIKASNFHVNTMEEGGKVRREPGMRAAYDPKGGRLHQIMRKLTGDRGTPVDFGKHQNAGDKGSPVFKNPDGTPKTNITAIAYDITKADPAVLQRLFTRPAGPGPETRAFLDSVSPADTAAALETLRSQPDLAAMLGDPDSPVDRLAKGSVPEDVADALPERMRDKLDVFPLQLGTRAAGDISPWRTPLLPDSAWTGTGPLAKVPWLAPRRQEKAAKRGKWQVSGLFRFGLRTTEAARLTRKQAQAVAEAEQRAAFFERAVKEHTDARAKAGEDAKAVRDEINTALGSTDNHVPESEVKRLEKDRKDAVAAARSSFMTDFAQVRRMRRDGDLGGAAALHLDLSRRLRDDIKAAKEAQDAGYTAARSQALADARARQAAAQAAVAARDPKFAKHLDEFRAWLDDMSRELTSDPAVSDTLKAVITDQLGLYLHRSYRVADGELGVKWARKVVDLHEALAGGAVQAAKARAEEPELVAVIEQAEVHIREELAREMAAKYLSENRAARKADPAVPKLTRDAARKQAEDFVNHTPSAVHAKLKDLMDFPHTGSQWAKATRGRKNLGILKHRKDIPSAVRALWGEHDDPRVNSVKTALALARFVHTSRFLKEFVDYGRYKPGQKDGEYFLVSADERLLLPNTRDWEPVTTKDEDEDSSSPLAGLYGPPEVRAALTELFSPAATQDLIQMASNLTAWAMASQTVFSVRSHMRNFVSNALFALGNGHFAIGDNGARFKQAYELIKADLLDNGPKPTRDLLQHMIRLGVIHDSNVVGLLRDLTKELALEEGTDANFHARFMHVFHYLTSRAGDWYQAGDDFWKAFAWFNERNRLLAAGKPAGEDLDKEAADKVRRTLPTYSQAPEVVRWLRTGPLKPVGILMSPFVTWTAEIIRVTGQTFKLAREEMRDPNPGIRKTGRLRMRSFVTTQAIPTAAAWMIPQLMQALIRAMWDDKDKMPAWAADMAEPVSYSERKALRRFVPPWSRNATLLVFGKKTLPDGTAEYSYIDISFTDPFDYWKRLANAVRFADSAPDAARDLATQMIEPFVGEQMLAGSLLDIARGQYPGHNDSDDWIGSDPGRELVSLVKGLVTGTHDTSSGKLVDAVLHVAEQAMMPGTVKSVQDLAKGVAGYAEGGKVYTPGAQLTNFAGVSTRVVNPAKSAEYAARGSTRALQDAWSVFNKAFKDIGTVGDKQLADSYAIANDRRKAVLADMRRMTLDLKRLGVPDKRVWSILRESGLKEDEVKMVAANTYVRHEPTRDARISAKLSPDATRREQDRNAVWRAARDKYPATQPLLDNE